MKTLNVLFVAVGLVAALVVAACDDADVASARPMGSVWAAASGQLSSPGGEGAGAGQGQGNKRRFKEALVYVDGVPRAKLTYSELPPQLKPRVVQRGPEPFPLFPFDAYLKGIGVDPAKVRAIHLVGGRRTAAMEGTEMRRLSERLCFAFTRTTRGQPRMEWPEEPYEASTSVDLLSQIQVFIEKDPPKWDPVEKFFYLEPGVPIEGVPYADPDKKLQGTRVYVDGELRRALSRRDVGGKPRALRDVLQDLDIAVEQVKHADLLQGDEAYVRIAAADLAAVTVEIPKQSKGIMVATVPRDASAQRAEGITAVQVYVEAPLFDRDEKYYGDTPFDQR